MKQILLAALVMFTINANANGYTEINEKVLKAFSETFTNARNVVWNEVGTVFEASFVQASIKTRASYDTEGNLLGTTRYYQEANLPPHILAKVKRKYAGKTVFGITEITREDNVAYYIKLQDDKNWYTIKADNWGSLELFEKYRKA